ncbi:NUDIX domain-containing protein [Candidatus Parcubacteria bacterium]|nr:NUDIX domain-containing protein [Candidatus Parcubacteria bacterium]
MTKEKLFPRIGVGVLIQNKKSEVLMGLRQGSHGVNEWCFPGGHLEFGETIFETAKRETKEEVGLNVSDFELISVADEMRYIKTNNKHYLNIGIKAIWNGDKPKLMEPEKCKEWQWFDLEKLPKNMLGGTKLTINNFKKGKTYDNKRYIQSCCESRN